MAEYRLSQVARKLNVGKNTIIDFLSRRGYKIDGNPNTKINQNLYDLLSVEFKNRSVLNEAVLLTIGGNKKEAPPTDLKNKNAKKSIKAFISYSWDNEGHMKWVLKLAAELIRNGIDVMIDEWDLEDYNNDINHFMESGIEKSNTILMVCTPNYADRADQRKGGVGIESMIITNEVYKKQTKKRFIPIVRSSNHNESLPIFLRTKFFIDFSNDLNFNLSFDLLLRKIMDKPRYKRPQLGELPDLPSEEL